MTVREHRKFNPNTDMSIGYVLFSAYEVGDFDKSANLDTFILAQKSSEPFNFLSAENYYEVFSVLTSEVG